MAGAPRDGSGRQPSGAGRAPSADGLPEPVPSAGSLPKLGE